VAQPTIPVMQYSMASEMGTAIGLHLDSNFNTLVESVTEIIANLGLIQRDDGEIRNQTVHANTFTSDALALMAGSSVVSSLDWRPMGFWATATLYRVGNIIETGSPAVAYVAAVQHTSGVFATDYAAGKWVVLSSPRQLTSGDVTSALGYTPVDVAGDTMTGALTLVTGSKFGGAAGMEIDDALMASQSLLTVDKGIYVAYEANDSDINYGFAANVVRDSGAFLTVGSQSSAIGTSGAGSTLFGSNFNAVGLSGFSSALVGQEIDVGSFTPNNTSNKYGLNIIFFNRGGTNPGEYSYTFPFGSYTSAGGGLGSNFYNKNAKAIVIESQERSSAGEYCGWTRGVYFGEYSLDIETDAAYPSSRSYPIGIDFSGLHYYGGTDPVTSFNLEAAVALRDFQSIWWNRDPSTAATATNKVRSYFNPATSRWVIENGGAEKLGVDVTGAGGLYVNGVAFTGGAQLNTPNVWTSSNTFNGPVTFASVFAFSGTGRRILGDFSNATVTNRVLVQTNSANSATEFGVIPTGSAQVSGIYVLSDSAAANGQVGRISVDNTKMEITSGVLGAGTYVPMVFASNGTEVARFETTNNALLINTSTPSAAGAVRLRVNGMIACDSPAAFSVHRNGVNQVVADSTPTVIAFTTEEFDTNNLYNTGTNRYTPPVGKYALMGAVSCAAGAAVDQAAIVVAIYKNGAQYKSGNFATMSGAGNTGSHVACIVDANGTDYFQLLVTHSGTGVNMTMTGAATDTWFQGYRIG
jgi:hypothetical protein